LAQAIAQLEHDAPLRNLLGRRAQVHAFKFSVQHMLNQHLALYAKLAGEARN
jgi:DNA-directed RNA polymerase subunit L